MTRQVIHAVAEFESDRLIERTQAGIRRAKAEGKTFGRPSALTGEQRAVVVDRLNAGAPVAQIARDIKTSSLTIMQVREGLAVGPAPPSLRQHSDARKNTLSSILDNKKDPPKHRGTLGRAELQGWTSATLPRGHTRRESLHMLRISYHLNLI